MLGPILKRAAEKYTKEHDTFKAKAIKEHNEGKKKIYASKQKGAWHLYKAMEQGNASPMLAVKRNAKRAEQPTQRYGSNILERSG